MGKRASKKQKTAKEPVVHAQPLGAQVPVSLLDDATKDDEERRLESMLFGTKYVPAPVNDDHILVVSEDENEDLGGGQELQNLMDTDVCILMSVYVVTTLNMPLALLRRRRHRRSTSRTDTIRVRFCDGRAHRRRG